MASEPATHKQVVEATAEAAATRSPRRVPVNVYEATEALVVLAPVPAVTANDVTVELRAGKLKFFARLRSAGPRTYLVREWDYGGWEREIDVPDGYGSGVEASLTNGQLAIRVLRGKPTAPIVIQPTVLAGPGGTGSRNSA
jgi:HSP20 family molecular chaperone IbpA